MVHLKGLINLKRLILADTQISDAGLVHLRGLRRLQELEVSDLMVPRVKADTAWYENFKGALPTKILWHTWRTGPIRKPWRLAKTRLQHAATAVAINVYRRSDWLGASGAVTRTSPLARLVA